MEDCFTTRRRPLKSHFDALVYFFSKMDADMIFDLLDDQRAYQGFERHVFVRKLGDLFYDLHTMGETQLHPLVDDGPLPVDGNFGVTFECVNTSLYLDIVFEVDEIGYVIDIYEISDVVEDDYANSKRQRIFIDQFVESDEDLFADDDDRWFDADMDDEPF